MEINELNALVRVGSGKGHSRRLRKEGLIPAVFYGPGTEAILLDVNSAELMSLRKKEEKGFIKLMIAGQDNKFEKLAVLKELQIEPLSRRMVHADFYEITMDHEFTFEIPIHFSGKPKGVDEGGELHLLKRELKVSCLPGARPESVNADISSLQVGDSFKVRDLAPSDGVIVLDHEDTVIATVSAPKAIVKPEGEAEAIPSETPPAK
ncbi:MAG: 50S ribosomal protein L25 [Deltaproteobacteria bacterium]|nr:50S ribosomal protein L25 [Deltaproteobacteria bacterium]